MARFLYSTVKTAIVASILLLAVQGKDGLKGDFNGSLQYITSADGISFYANHQLHTDFEAASNYCKSFNMELGSIRTRRQYYALMDKLRPAYNYGYWTSATLSRRPSMFQWGSAGGILEESEIPSWQNQWFTVNFCVIIYNSNTDIHPAGLYAVGCSNEQPVLCQTTFKY